MNDEHSSEGVCPCCGRFTGRASLCEYCDSDLPESSLLRQCRRWCGLLTVVALALLWVKSGEQSIKQIAAEDITPAMNHALVRFLGVIESKPYAKDGGAGVDYVSFVLRDGRGSVRVSLQGEDAAEFASPLSGPRKGTKIEAVGVLQVRAGAMPRLFVRRLGGKRAWKPVM
jgi:hypothetical protein